mgnify:CR=1 FL=1
MAVTWKINGATIGSLSIAKLALRLVNQVADRLTFERSLEAVNDDLYTVAPSVTISGGGGSGATGTTTVLGGIVNSISLTNPGSGYTSTPTVVLSGTGSASAAARLTPTTVSSISLVSAGSGYTSAPDVVISGGGGTGATASAQLPPRGVGSVVMTNGGTGYTSTPTVSLTGGGGTGATAVAVLSGGAVVGIAITNGGIGYTSAPTVSFTGGGGSGAAATASLTYGVGSVTVHDHGFLQQPPAVSFVGGGGTGATGEARFAPQPLAYVLTTTGSGYPRNVEAQVLGGSSPAILVPIVVGGVVTQIKLVSGGGGYSGSSASVHFYFSGTGPGSGAAATATIVAGVVTAVAITNGGSGYNDTPVCSVLGGGGSGAVVVALSIYGGGGLQCWLASAGTGYTHLPSITIVGGGTGAAANPFFSASGGVDNVVITSPGTGYTSAPTVVFEGTGISATANLAGVVDGVTITNGGTGYTSAPTVGFSGGGGTGATATASVAKTVGSVSITNAGSGYTSPPAVSFSGGGGTGAAGTSVLQASALASLTLLTPGGGFTSTPTIEISGGGGTGAVASLALATTTVAELIITHPGGSYDIDTPIELSRQEGSSDPVVWFRGVIRRPPRRLMAGEEVVAYEAEGPWQWLDRVAFLQSFKTASDPDDTESSLVTYLRGRAIIAQNHDGDKISVKEFLEEVLAYCAAAVLTRTGDNPFTADVSDSLDVTIPWDEVNDLSCADVISRVLSLIPDAICWFDYAENPPVFHISRRSELEALDLPIAPSGSGEFASAVRNSIELAPLPQFKKAGVVLIYIATHRANEAAFETYEIDRWPLAAVPNDPDVLVRTIQLAGAIAQSTVLTQKVDVDPIPSGLVYNSTTWLASGSQFDSLRDWWQAHAPELNSSFVTIKGFAKCTREGDSMGTAGQLNNELVRGAITDWMEDVQGVSQEDQVITAFIAYEEARPNDSTKKARHLKKFTAVVKATNAQTKTYTFTAASSATPPEEVPSGLARAIYDAINPLHYEGALQLVEAEPTLNRLVGRALNLTGDLAAWETMDALIQEAEIDIDAGTTRLTLGPPRHLGVGELVDLFRVNRTRPSPVSWETRTTGRSGSSSSQQGLGFHHRGGALASGIAQAPGRYTSAMSVAGLVPTASEITTAVAAAYSSDNIPVEGDVISLTVSGAVKFQAIVTLTAIAPENWRRVSFTFSSVTYYAWVQQIGIY